MHDMDSAKRIITTLMVATIVLASVVAFITPLSAGAGNASASAITKSSAASTTKASAAAVKTAPLAGAGTWHNQTVDSNGMVGGHTSLALTPSGWPAISYYDFDNGTLKYTYKDGSGWHNQVVDSIGAVS